MGVPMGEARERFDEALEVANRLTDAAGQEIVRLGSDLEDGIAVTGAGRWVLEPVSPKGN